MITVRRGRARAGRRGVGAGTLRRQDYYGHHGPIVGVWLRWGRTLVVAHKRHWWA